MNKYSYTGSILNGKLHLSDKQRGQMSEDISRMKSGKLVEIVLRPLPIRSNAQNAYMWSVIIPEITAELKRLGHEVNNDLTHELLKAKFNPKHVRNEDAEVIAEYGGSTTEMTTRDFMEYIDRIIKWAAESLSLVIPLPNEQTKIDF